MIANTVFFVLKKINVLKNELHIAIDFIKFI